MKLSKISKLQELLGILLLLMKNELIELKHLVAILKVEFLQDIQVIRFSGFGIIFDNEGLL